MLFAGTEEVAMAKPDAQVPPPPQPPPPSAPDELLIGLIERGGRVNGEKRV